MDAAEFLVTVGGALLIVLTLWFFLGGRKKAAPPVAVVYACPMHPWITSDQPAGTCSLCGMPLVRRNGKGANRP
jgi:hypothetical protein